MAAPATRRTLRDLLRQGWNEIPEVLASSGLAIVGIGLAFAGVYKYYQNDGDNRRYKLSYIVLRPDDPRVQKIRKD